MKIREIMTDKLVTVRPSDTVSQAARFMRDANIGDVLVTSEDGRHLGILTDRDIAVRVVAQELDTNRAQVGDFMTEGLITASPDMNVEDAANIMAEGQVRRLPIVENDRLVGIVSLGDIAEDLGSVPQSPACEALEDISRPAKPQLDRLSI